MSPPSQLIVGNWKMHTLRAEAERLAQEVRDGASAVAAQC